ncbi:MAG: P-II family nitrogen regulator [Eubacteriales bacterium]
MDNNTGPSGNGLNGIEMLCIIVNFGQSGKIIKKAKSCGVLGATVLLGDGTVSNSFLCYLGLTDIRKEIILMIADKSIAGHALEEINREFEFKKPNHGIAFSTTICGAFGAHNIACDKIGKERGADYMYYAITTIVEKGRAEDVIDAATKAGSKGGTIINARGSGIHETSKLFSMEIEPEKEIVIILSEADRTEDIIASIREKLRIDEPGNGIVYVQGVDRTFGIYK